METRQGEEEESIRAGACSARERRLFVLKKSDFEFSRPVKLSFFFLRSHTPERRSLSHLSFTRISLSLTFPALSLSLSLRPLFLCVQLRAASLSGRAAVLRAQKQKKRERKEKQGARA